MSFSARIMPATFGGGGGSTALYSGTITQGYYNALYADPNTGLAYGYYQMGLFSGYGSRTPTVLTDAKTLLYCYDIISFNGGSPTYGAVLQVSGFGADPGIAYLAKGQLAGQIALQAAAASYSYSGGIATWSWVSLFGFTASGDIGLTLTGA